MKVLFIILNQEDYLDDVLSTLVKYNVKGATIVDSQGMGSAIVNNDYTDIPLFGSLKNLLKEQHPHNKTIFTVIEDDDLLEKVVNEIKVILKDAKKPSGFMFTLPVEDIIIMN